MTAWLLEADHVLSPNASRSRIDNSAQEASKRLLCSWTDIRFVGDRPWRRKNRFSVRQSRMCSVVVQSFLQRMVIDARGRPWTRDIRVCSLNSAAACSGVPFHFKAPHSMLSCFSKTSIPSLAFTVVHTNDAAFYIATPLQ